MRVSYLLSAVAIAGVSMSGIVHADVITPQTYPTASSQGTDVWYTDRYAPASFENVGTYQSRDDVLRIGISEDDSAANRPGSYSSSFYSTQGRKYDIQEPYVVSLSASLYLDSGWQNLSDETSRRTGMWGTVSPDGNPDCPQSNCNLFPILGFVSDGDGERFRVWDGDIGWVDFATAISYDAWTDLQMVWTGTSLDYFINGANVYSDTTVTPGDTSYGPPLQLANIIMQAYNYGQDYDVYWSNIQVETMNVPEPMALAIFGVGLAGMGLARRRKSA